MHTASLLMIVGLACTALAGIDDFDSSVSVTYASVVRLVSPSTGLFVHSHDIFFGRGGVMSISGYHLDDLGSFWQLNQQHQRKTHTYSDYIHCGDTITISSVIMGYFMRVEDTQFGLTTELLPMVHGMNPPNIDDKVNFQIQCIGREQGETIHYNDHIRLKHSISGKYVSLDNSYAYTEANCGRGCEIAGQLQLHAIDNPDETTMFAIKTGISFDPSVVDQ